MKAMELYELLNQIGLQFEVVEIFEGVRILRVCVEELADDQLEEQFK